MNTPTGIQVPAKLLPAIDEVLLSHERVGMFVVPGVDKAIVEHHWETLQLELGSRVKFVDLRGKVENAEEFHTYLHNLRMSRDRVVKPTFYLYSFSPRFPVFEMDMDVSFYYCPGACQVNLQRGKLRRANVLSDPKVLELLPVIQKAQRQSDDLGRLQVIIVGDKNRTGKSQLATIIKNAIRRELPEIDLEHYSQEEQTLVDRVDAKVLAKTIQIVDLNGRTLSRSQLAGMPMADYAAQTEPESE